MIDIVKINCSLAIEAEDIIECYEWIIDRFEKELNYVKLLIGDRRSIAHSWW